MILWTSKVVNQLANNRKEIKCATKIAQSNGHHYFQFLPDKPKLGILLKKYMDLDQTNQT